VKERKGSEGRSNASTKKYKGKKWGPEGKSRLMDSILEKEGGVDCHKTRYHRTGKSLDTENKEINAHWRRDGCRVRTKERGGPLKKERKKSSIPNLIKGTQKVEKTLMRDRVKNT